jgi:ABC-type transport system substrate-binding protein
VWADDNRLERTALLLQKQLFDVGIDMKLEPMTSAVLLPRIAAGKFDAFLFEMANGRTLSWVYTFWHSPTHDVQTYNFTGYSAADAVLDRIRSARSDEEVRAATADLEQTFRENPPAVFLAWQTQARAVSRRFAVVAEPNRDILSTAWQWKLAGPQQAASR